MIKKFVFAAALLCSSIASIYASSVNNVPERFHIIQRWVCPTVTFDIETANHNHLGYVTRKFCSLHTEYDFYDVEQMLKAKAILRWVSVYPIFDIVDQLNEPMGKVEGYVLSLFPKFDLISADGKLLAIAKMNFSGTKFTLIDPETQKEMATIARSLFRLKDNWTVTVTSPELFETKNIDSRLFITVAVFQSDVDTWNCLNVNCLSHTDRLFDRELSNLQEFLLRYKSLLPIQPQDKDYVFADSLLESLFNQENNGDRCQQLIEIMHKVIPFMDAEELNPEQKTAVYQLLEKKANELREGKCCHLTMIKNFSEGFVQGLK